MATIKQIEANRRNALQSTGSKTPEGKAAVRLNALRHGLPARSCCRAKIPRNFSNSVTTSKPNGGPSPEQFYVEQMAVSQWKLNRMEMAECSVFAQTSDTPKPSARYPKAPAVPKPGEAPRHQTAPG